MTTVTSGGKTFNSYKKDKLYLTWFTYVAWELITTIDVPNKRKSVPGTPSTSHNLVPYVFAGFRIPSDT